MGYNEPNITNSDKLLTGLFRDHESAERAYQIVLSQGYEPEDVTLIMSDETRDLYFPNQDGVVSASPTALGSKALEGLGVGSAIGGTLGAVLAGALAVGSSLVLPGLGLVVAGPLAASLAGAGAGGVTGGIIGALIGTGVPNDRAQTYQEDIKAGGILIGVTPKNEEDYNNITNQWKRY